MIALKIVYHCINEINRWLTLLLMLHVVPTMWAWVALVVSLNCESVADLYRETY